MLRRDFFNSIAALGAAFRLPDAIPQSARSAPTLLRPPVPAIPMTTPAHAVARAPVADPIARRTITLQHSAVAGFQFHLGEQVWPALTIGAPLTLIREPENRFDSLAIRVEWNGQKIGYVPRAVNEIAAGLLDRGERLSASIMALAMDDNPWERIGIEIGVVV